MSIAVSQFDWAKEFVGFTETDAQHLAALAGVIETHGPAITDHFYDVIQSTPETAAAVAGRIDHLKRTHLTYMRQLVAGRYDQEYFESRVRVGKVHVIQAIEPHWVEAVMSIIRTQLVGLISTTFSDPEERAAKAKAVLRILDLDLILINFAYAEERLERLSKFTGMGRKLIENVIKMAPKK